MLSLGLYLLYGKYIFILTDSWGSQDGGSKEGAHYVFNYDTSVENKIQSAVTASTLFTIWEMSRRKHCEDAAAGEETKGGEREGMGYDEDRQIGVVPTADYREINVNKWTTHVGAQKQQRGDGRARQKKQKKRKQMMMTMAMRLTTAMRGR